PQAGYPLTCGVGLARQQVEWKRGNTVGLPLLIFLLVTLGLTAGYYAFSSLVFRDADIVRSRVNNEFRKGGEKAPRSQIFKVKTCDQINLDQPPASLHDLDLPEPADPTGPNAGLRARVEILLEQSALRITVNQLLLLTGGLALLLGVAGTWVRGPFLGL